MYFNDKLEFMYIRLSGVLKFVSAQAFVRTLSRKQRLRLRNFAEQSPPPPPPPQNNGSCR